MFLHCLKSPYLAMSPPGLCRRLLFWIFCTIGPKETLPMQRVVRLSGGQVQRIAIARALYGDPDLLIFDEATSSLDMKNEKAIYETILSLCGKITIVVTAHRLTTVEGCDSVIWLDKGTIRQAGAAHTVLEVYREMLDADPSCAISNNS